jgi:hypothetical protein
MNLPWILMLHSGLMARAKRQQAAIISAVNIGYCGSKDKEANRKMRSVLEDLLKGD